MAGSSVRALPAALAFECKSIWTATFVVVLARLRGFRKFLLVGGTHRAAISLLFGEVSLGASLSAASTCVRAIFRLSVFAEEKVPADNALPTGPQFRRFPVRMNAG